MLDFRQACFFIARKSMIERSIIQSRGAKNVVLENGQPGFQFQLRNPNYRGVQASLIDGIDVTLNGKS